MKPSSIWNFRFIGCRVIAGLIFSAMICSICVVPAMGKDGRRNDRGRYEDRGRGHGYGRHEYRGYDCYRVVHGRRVYQPCNAGPPVIYTQPRVIHTPPPPAGIHVFLPPIYFPFDH